MNVAILNFDEVNFGRSPAPAPQESHPKLEGTQQLPVTKCFRVFVMRGHGLMWLKQCQKTINPKNTICFWVVWSPFPVMGGALQHCFTHMAVERR